MKKLLKFSINDFIIKNFYQIFKYIYIIYIILLIYLILLILLLLRYNIRLMYLNLANLMIKNLNCKKIMPFTNPIYSIHQLISSHLKILLKFMKSYIHAGILDHFFKYLLSYEFHLNLFLVIIQKASHNKSHQ